MELLNKDIKYRSLRKKTPKSRCFRLLGDTGSEEMELDPKVKFICDRFISELNKRKEAYIEKEEKFGILFKLILIEMK